MRSARFLVLALVELVVLARAATAFADDAGPPDAAGLVDAGADAAVSPWIEEPFPFADASIDENCISGVAFAGNQVLAGFPCFDTSGSIESNDQGSVYVLERQGDRWAYAGQNLIASDGAMYDDLGDTLAVDGDTAVFGASGDGRVLSPVANVQPYGAAWVFVRSAGRWTQQQKLVAPDAAVNDYFGTAVAISKDTIAIGAPRRTIGAIPEEGTVFIFVRSGTHWSLQQELVLPPVGGDAGADSDGFGGVLALDGDTLLAGTPQRRVGPNRFQGSAFAYARSGTTWSLQQQVVLAMGAAADELGASVALQGDRAMIGATGAAAGNGTAVPFSRAGAVWGEQPQLPPITDPVQDRRFFGENLAMDGNLLLLAAPQATPRDVFSEGMVAAYARTAAGWQYEQLLLPDNEIANEDMFGRDLAVAGNHALIVGNRLHAYARAALDVGPDGGSAGDADGGLEATGDGGSGAQGSSSGGPSTACDGGDCAQGASPVSGSGGCGCRVSRVDPRSWAGGVAMFAVAAALWRRSRRS